MATQVQIIPSALLNYQMHRFKGFYVGELFFVGNRRKKREGTLVYVFTGSGENGLTLTNSIVAEFKVTARPIISRLTVKMVNHLFHFNKIPPLLIT